MTDQSDKPTQPKNEMPNEQTVRQDIETIERERLAQQKVQETGREDAGPATGVVADEKEKPRHS